METLILVLLFCSDDVILLRTMGTNTSSLSPQPNLIELIPWEQQQKKISRESVQVHPESS